MLFFHSSQGIDKEQSIIVNNYVINASTGRAVYYEMFKDTNFNSPITIGANVRNCTAMFQGAEKFNQPVEIPASTRSCYRMFKDAEEFNQIVTFKGNNVQYLEQMFNNCTNYNQPFTIPNNVINCTSLFHDCTNFNQPITIPESVTNCYEMFYNCQSFNLPIAIPNGVTNCSTMFSWCTSFNRPITIPEYAVDCNYMFSHSAINQSVIIPASVNGGIYMFYNCTSFAGNLYFKGTGQINVRWIFRNTSNSLRKNVYFHQERNSIFNVTNMESLVGESIKWTDMTNGFYNVKYNVYCYYNYTG